MTPVPPARQPTGAPEPGGEGDHAREGGLDAQNRAGNLLDRVEAMLRETSPDAWWEGPTFRSPCGTKHCVLSHIAEQFGMDAMEEFENTWSTSYVIGAAVNDKPSEKYPQPHPKDRVLAYIANLRSGVELDTWSGIDAQPAAERERA